MVKTQLVLNKEFNGTTDFSLVPTLAPNPTQGTVIVVFTPYDNRRSLIFYTGPTTSGNGLGAEDEFNIITDFVPSPMWSSIGFYWGSGLINGNFYDFNAITNYIPNTEYHLAIRYKNNGPCDSLINGVVTNSDNVAKSIDTSTWGQTIIGKPTENTRYFKGFIKRVMVADYIMTDAEVMADYSPICTPPTCNFTINQ